MAKGLPEAERYEAQAIQLLQEVYGDDFGTLSGKFIEVFVRGFVNDLLCEGRGFGLEREHIPEYKGKKPTQKHLGVTGSDTSNFGDVQQCPSNHASKQAGGYPKDQWRVDTQNAVRPKQKTDD